LQLEIDKFLMN